MEVLFEPLIANQLTRGGTVFVAPSYDLPGCCPDFVARDFGKTEIIVVEVTTAWNLSKLIEKIETRQQYCYEPLRAVEGLPDWSPRLIGLVRRERLTAHSAEICRRKYADVTFVALEDCIFQYDYSGGARRDYEHIAKSGRRNQIGSG